MSDYNQTKPKVRTEILDDETRDAVLKRFPKVIEFARETGISNKISRDRLYGIFRKDPATLKDLILVKNAWIFLNNTDFDRDIAEKILEYGVSMVKKHRKIDLNSREILDNLNKLDKSNPFKPS